MARTIPMYATIRRTTEGRLLETIFDTPSNVPWIAFDVVVGFEIGDGV